MRQQQALQQAQLNSKGQVTHPHISQHSGLNSHNPSAPQGFNAEKQRPVNPSFVGNPSLKPTGVHSSSLGQTSEIRPVQTNNVNPQHFANRINHSKK
jgi:hypothetical protein